VSQFVEECRKEWHRLGVAEAVANEMAADLEVDLAEAEADGVGPEAVLGNGFFDAQAFAASWAEARGVADTGRRTPGSKRPPVWALAAGAAVFMAAVLLGLVLVVGGHRFGSASVASAAPVSGPILRQPLVPGLFVGPRRVMLGRPVFAVAALGGVVVLAGLVGLIGLCVSLWLWRSRSGRGSGPDRDIAMPSYL
jgi:hypothetical protein